MVNFKGYDPLVANGILPASVHDILNSDMPLPSQVRCRVLNSQNNDDRFVPSSKKQNENFSWGKWILGSMAATASILGIKKYGLRGFLTKFKPSNIKAVLTQGFEAIKKVFTKTP